MLLFTLKSHNLELRALNDNINVLCHDYLCLRRVASYIRRNIELYFSLLFNYFSFFMPPLSVLILSTSPFPSPSLYVCLFVRLSVCLSACQSVCLFSSCLSVCLPTYLSFSLSFLPPICPSFILQLPRSLYYLFLFQEQEPLLSPALSLQTLNKENCYCYFSNELLMGNAAADAVFT